MFFSLRWLVLLVFQPFRHYSSSMWSCSIFLEPLLISINVMTCPKCPPGLVKHHNVTLFCDSDCLPICVFKPEQPDYATFWHHHYMSAYYRVEVPLRPLVWGLCTPEHIVLAIYVPREQKVPLIAEPNIIKECTFLFDLVLEPSAHHNICCPVSWCEFFLYLDIL